MKQQDENIIELDFFGHLWLLNVDKAALIDPLYEPNSHLVNVDVNGDIIFHYPVWNEPDQGFMEVRVVTHTASAKKVRKRRSGMKCECSQKII